MRSRSRLIGYAFAIIGTFLFATKPTFIKLAYEYGVATTDILILRMAFSTPVYLAVLLIFWRRGAALTRNDIIQAVFLGVVGYYIASYLDFFGLNYISAQLERLILFSYPTIIVIAMACRNKEAPQARMILSLILTYSGLLIVFGHDLEALGGEAWIGAVLVFLAAIAYAGFVMGSKPIMTRIGSVRFTSISMLAAAVAIFLHAGVEAAAGVSDLSFKYPWQVWAIGAGIAFFATILSTFLIADAIHRLEPVTIAIIGNLSPLATSVLAVIVLGEAFTVYHLVGFALTATGVGLITLPRKES